MDEPVVELKDGKLTIVRKPDSPEVKVSGPPLDVEVNPPFVVRKEP